MRTQLLFAILVLMLGGCSDPVLPQEPPPDDLVITDPKIILPADGYGVLHHAIRNITVELPGFTDSLTTAVYGKAIAGFYENPGDTAFSAAACAVKLDAFTLQLQSDGSYEYDQSGADSSMYRRPINWNVSCKSINLGVSPTDFTTKPVIRSVPVIYRLGGYTAVNDLIPGADSVVYQIQSSTYAGTTTVQKTQAGNSTQCVFTSTDLLKLSASNYGLLTVTAYTVSANTFGGKKYYSTFQHSQSRLVIIY